MTTPDTSSFFNLTSIAGITAGVALLGGYWRQVIAFFQSFTRFILCDVAIDDQDTATRIASYCKVVAKQSPFRKLHFFGKPFYVNTVGRTKLVIFENIDGKFILFNGIFPIFVNVSSSVATISSKTNGNGSRLSHSTQPTDSSDSTNSGTIGGIRFFRWTFDVRKFIIDANSYSANIIEANDLTASETKRFNIVYITGEIANGYGSQTKEEKRDDNALLTKYIPLGIATPMEYDINALRESTIINSKNPFTVYPIPDIIQSEFDSMASFLAERAWYNSRGIPWYRGYLLHGAPGTGKDTIIKNIALKYDLPVYYIDLSSHTNADFKDSLNIIKNNAPAIVVFSDFDVVFNGRKNVINDGKMTQGISFDFFLNSLSGVGVLSGIIAFFTVNNISVVDEAIGIPVELIGDNANVDSWKIYKSTRPGRVDKVITIGTMQKRERRVLAEFILDTCPEEEINATIDAGEGETAAQFQNRCATIALKARKQS
jgi:hypothetical protein